MSESSPTIDCEGERVYTFLKNKNHNERGDMMNLTYIKKKLIFLTFCTIPHTCYATSLCVDPRMGQLHITRQNICFIFSFVVTTNLSPSAASPNSRNFHRDDEAGIFSFFFAFFFRLLSPRKNHRTFHTKDEKDTPHWFDDIPTYPRVHRLLQNPFPSLPPPLLPFPLFPPFSPERKKKVTGQGFVSCGVQCD